MNYLLFYINVVFQDVPIHSNGQLITFYLPSQENPLVNVS